MSTGPSGHVYAALSPFCEAVGPCGPVRVAAEPSGLVNETPGPFGPVRSEMSPSDLAHAPIGPSSTVCSAMGPSHPVGVGIVCHINRYGSGVQKYLYKAVAPNSCEA